MQNEAIKKMLEDVKLIIATNRGERFRQGKEFNIFWIQGTANKEVKICRLIRELIDPNGSHGQGDIFLRSFIKNVLKVEKLGATSEDYKRAHVVCEELIKDAKDYYSKTNKIYPNINYVFHVNDNNLREKIVLRFEIEERLYFGISPWSGENNFSEKKSKLAENYVKDKLTPSRVVKENTSKCWYWWLYLNVQNNINFKNCNAGYEKLFDQKGFEGYMKPIYAAIDEIMDYIERSKRDGEQELLNQESNA